MSEILLWPWWLLVGLSATAIVLISAFFAYLLSGEFGLKMFDSNPIEAGRGPEFQSFIEEIDREIRWEWKWEKRHRRWMWAVIWANWATRILLLGLAAYQVQASQYGRTSVTLSVLVSISVLSALNIALPLINFQLRFPQRQEVHDTHARAYCVIRLELTTGVITLDEAVNRFKEVRLRPTEAIIRKTP